MLKSIQSNNSPGHSHNGQTPMVDLSTDFRPGVLLKRNNKMKHIQEQIRKVLKKIKFTFNYGDEIFVGYSDGTRWNGWDNISVTEDVYDEIENYFDNDADCEMEIKKGENGLYSYGYGFTTSIIKEVK